MILLARITLKSKVEELGLKTAPLTQSLREPGISRAE